MATKPKAKQQMPRRRTQMVGSQKAAPHLSDHDMELLRPYLQRLTIEIHGAYGSPGFPHKVRELAAAIRNEIDENNRIESTNGYVPLYEAEDALILETLEKLARARTIELLDELAITLKQPRSRAYPSDCEVLERNVLVHGALVTFNCRHFGSEAGNGR